MGLIEKDDLNFDYDWSSQAGNDPVKKDDIGSNVFNSTQGEAVLSILNDYAEEKEITNKDDILEAEDLLRNKIPKNLNTKNDVMDWLWSKLNDRQPA